MLLPKFDYHEPRTVDEATRLMSEIGKNACVLAGGTDLLVNMKKGKVSAKHVVCLGRIEDLRQVGHDNGWLRVGACTVVADLTHREEIKADFNAVSEAAESIGSPLIRNLATLGGNLVTARPAADLPPPLIAYGANVALKSANGERTLPVETLITGPGKTMLEPGEILCHVVLPEPPPYSGGAYMKFGVRRSLEISIVNAAAFLALDGPDGVIQVARIVLGAVAPLPVRSPTAEGLLLGQRPEESLFAKAGEAAVSDARPIDDFRACAEYRREMVKVFVRKALRQAYEEAKLREWRRWK